MDKYEVLRSIADNLIGDVKVATARVSRLGGRHASSLPLARRLRTRKINHAEAPGALPRAGALRVGAMPTNRFLGNSWVNERG